MSGVANPPDGHDPSLPVGDPADGPASGQMAGESVADAATTVPRAGVTQESVQAAAQRAPAPPRPAQATAPPAPTAAQLALETGWTMAVLYGKIEPAPLSKVPHLATANELQPAARRELELDRLHHLLLRLAHMPEMTGSGLPVDVPSAGADVEALPAALTKLNLDILCALAAARPEPLLAYELGRSLRDTANPPDDPDQHPPAPALSRQFKRDRIATLQGWLATLSGELPQPAAAVVVASLGRWSEFATITASTPTARLKDDDAAKVSEVVCEYLLRQGDLWLMLLTGARATSGLLSPEGYVAAGELALRRSAAIIRRILQHYWAALFTGAVALGVILSLAAIYLGGAARVWTTIAAIAGSLGISARAIASTSARLAAEAERPVFAIAEEDVMAWAITTMPQLRLAPARVRQLRKAGIAPTSSLGRV